MIDDVNSLDINSDQIISCKEFVAIVIVSIVECLPSLPAILLVPAAVPF